MVRDHRAVGLHFAFRISVTEIGVTRNFLDSERKLIATLTWQKHNNIHFNIQHSLDDDSVVLRAPGGQVEGHQERPAHHHHQEDDPTDGVIGLLSIAFEEVLHNGQSPIQLKKDKMYLEFRV